MKKNSLILLSFIIFLASLLAYRLISSYWQGSANFSPMQAAVLCGAAFFSLRFAILLPLVWIFSSIFINILHNYEQNWPFLLVNLIIIAAIFYLGRKIRKKNVFYLFGGAILSAILFYLMTNSFSWLTNSQYAKSFTGYWQALTIGLPGYPPTWTFFRNSIFSNLFFTAIFILTFMPLKLIYKEKYIFLLNKSPEN